MQRYNNREILGTVKINKNTISSIASLATLEIKGVKSIGRKNIISFFEKFLKISLNKIKVKIHENGEVSIEIPIIVKYGFNLGEVAAQVQENVYNAIEKMSGISVKEININIQGVEKEETK